MWNSLRSDLFREVDEHYEFYLTGGRNQAMGATRGN